MDLFTKLSKLDTEWKNGNTGLFNAVYFLEKLVNRDKYYSFFDFKTRNEQAKRYFFSKNTMKAFKCKIESEIIANSFLIISQTNYNDSKRVYKIVIGQKDGEANYLLKKSFNTKSEALKMLKLIIKNCSL